MNVEKPATKGLSIFFASLGVITALRVLLALVPFPLELVQPLTILATIIFIALPIFALFRGADYPWSAKLALGFVVGGLVVQFGLVYLIQKLSFIAAVVALAVSQAALIAWCVGLGGLLTTKLKDKNLLIPVTIFLGSFDLFLVFAPMGPTKLIMRAAPQLLPSIGYAIPKIVHAPTTAPVAPYAFVGPADFVFMAMFFIAIYRFDMRARATFYALVPTLLAYLTLSYFFGAIPLLPPIAAVVLLVNLGEFKMTKEEKVSTLVVAVICAALLVWAATRPKPRVVIVPPAGVPAPQAQAAKPAPASPDRRR